MSSSRLKWPHGLADVPGFPVELVGALGDRGIRTIGDLVARVKQLNPGLIPPRTALGVNLWRLAPGGFSESNRTLCNRASEVLALYLGYREQECPRDWTDPPHLAPQPKPEALMPTPSTSPRLIAPAMLTLHPEAALVPEMPADQYKPFAADVKKRGVVKPIELLPGTLIVIDGRTRLRAANDADLAAVPVVEADLDGDSPVVYMMRVALLRRHLKPAQTAKLGNEIKKTLAAEMRQKKREGGKKGGEESGKSRRSEPEPKDAADGTHASVEKKPRAPGAREQAATMAGTTPKAIDAAAKIERTAPEVYEKMGTGEIPTLAAAKKAAAISLPQATRIVKSDFTQPPAKTEPTKAAAVAICATLHELNPCPFCGAQGEQLVNLGGHSIICHNCGAVGPNKSTDDAARAAWNKRAKK